MIDLKGHRKAAGLTQHDLAVRMRVCRDTISQLENNTGRITLDRLQGLANALSCYPADLLGFDGEAQEKLKAVRRAVGSLECFSNDEQGSVMKSAMSSIDGQSKR